MQNVYKIWFIFMLYAINKYAITKLCHFATKQRVKIEFPNLWVPGEVGGGKWICLGRIFTHAKDLLPSLCQFLEQPSRGRSGSPSPQLPPPSAFTRALTAVLKWAKAPLQTTDSCLRKHLLFKLICLPQASREPGFCFHWIAGVFSRNLGA